MKRLVQCIVVLCAVVMSGLAVAGIPPHLLQLARAGNANAQVAVAGMYYNVLNDPQKALYWTKKAAKAGNIAAMSLLGNLYAYGQGIPVDMQKAIHYSSIGVAHNNKGALDTLGSIYMYGIHGIKRNSNKAKTYLQRSAAQGYVPAYFHLAQLYYHGLGVPANKTKGIAYYTQAANKGYAEAQYKLGAIYQTGGGGTTQYTCFLHVVQISLVEW